MFKILPIALLPALAWAATQSFDPVAGRIAVDRAAYLSKHQIAVNGAITDSGKALTVGNGRVGAMVWNANGLTMQVTGVDASPQTAFSAGRVGFDTSPSLSDGSSQMKQILSLYDGSLGIHYADGRSVTVFGVPNSEILGIHVEDGRTNVTSATLDIGMWDPATQMTTRYYGSGFSSMMGDVPDVATWKSIATLAETTVAGISRGQTDANHFGYTLAATVEGASFTTSKVDGRTVRLSIVPSRSYTIYIVCASRLNATGWNSANQARQALGDAVATGYVPNITASREWWHAFWDKSFVQFSTTAQDADYLENYYYLATYMLACGSFAKYPMHFVNGVFRWDMDNDVHWSGAYWWWNMRNVYLGPMASNHVDAVDRVLDMYFGNLPAMIATTKSRYDVDGVWIPETMRWDGDARWTTSSDYTKGVLTTAAEVAMAMFDRFRYSGDSAYLRNKAYPMMKDAARFLGAKLTYDAAKGQYAMPGSYSHETYWNVPNPITDLAAIRALFPKAIQVSQALGVDADLRAKWQDVLAKLVPYKTETVNGQVRWLPHDPPISSTHNTENIACELAWPYSVTGIGSPDLQVAIQSYRTRPFAYTEIWSPDAIQAARLGLGDNAFTDLKQMQTKHQDRSNGLVSNTNGVFDFVGLVIPSINEMMLQSHNDTIRVFPALPAATGLVARFSLLATGGFLVTSEKEAGDVKYVGVKSLHGGEAVVFNPWGTAAIQVRSLPEDELVASGTSSSIAFPTVAGTSYVIERVATPFSGFAFSKLTGSGNWSAKQMTHGGKTVSLGSGSGTPLGAEPRGAAVPRLGDLRWRAGFLEVRGIEDGRLEILDPKGRSRMLDVHRGSAWTGRLAPGLYQARSLDPRSGAARSIIVLP